MARAGSRRSRSRSCPGEWLLILAVAVEALVAAFAALYLGLLLVPEALGVETFALFCETTDAADTYAKWAAVVLVGGWLAMVGSLFAAWDWDEPHRTRFLLLAPPGFVVAVAALAPLVLLLIGPQRCR